MLAVIYNTSPRLKFRSLFLILSGNSTPEFTDTVRTQVYKRDCLLLFDVIAIAVFSVCSYATLVDYTEMAKRIMKPWLIEPLSFFTPKILTKFRPGRRKRDQQMQVG